MFKTLVKALKNPSEHSLTDFGKNFSKTVREAKVSSEEIEKFVSGVKETGDVKLYLKNLFPGKHIEESVIRQLTSDLAKYNAKVAVREYFEHNLVKKLKLESLPSSSKELDALISKNNKLKNVVDKFIDVVKKNKLKLSLLSLSGAGAAAYLIDAAKNLSGCYKYEINTADGKEHILCKVKNCDSNKESVSINKQFCDDGNCSSPKCNKNTNCNFISNKPNISYHCFEASWPDVIGVVLKNFKDTFMGSFWTILKYMFVFVVATIIYTTLSDLQIYYRVILSASSGLLTYYILF